LAVSLKFKQTLPDLPKDYAAPIDEFAVDPTLSEPGAGAGIRAGGRVPQLNIVVMLVGSHGTRLGCSEGLYQLLTCKEVGDVQPHLALGRELSKHGHRVRIATHSAFRDIVSHTGLEFFDIGGDPNELMGYMMRSK
jgi:sterol 3beta-glucosyltransferase